MTEHQDENRQDAREALKSALKFLRQRSGKSLRDLSADTGYDDSFLSRLENGKRLSKREVMEDLDSYYECGDLLAKLWKAARDEVIADRYKLFMRYEASAVLMHKYMLVMPGLLQTEDYARVVLSSAPNHWTPDQLEEQVAARLGRQALLRQDSPPSMRVILDEFVLRRPTADPAIWRAQLEHLLDAAGQRTIALQVLPFSAGVHDLMGGSLSLLWQADGKGVVWLEGSKSGHLIEEPEEVTQYRLSYDQLRDAALSPSDSADFIKTIMEDTTS